MLMTHVRAIDLTVTSAGARFAGTDGTAAQIA
jgi:hypothetical protein